MLLVMVMCDAFPSWLLSLFLLHGHLFLVWGWREQVGPPLHHSLAGRPETHTLPISASISPSVMRRHPWLPPCELLPSLMLQPRCLSHSPFVFMRPQAPSLAGEAVEWVLALGPIAEFESDMCHLLCKHVLWSKCLSLF